jgi:hypothetical protein
MTENESSQRVSIRVVGTMRSLPTMTHIAYPLPIEIKSIFLEKVCYLNRSRELTVNRAYGADAANADSEQSRPCRSTIRSGRSMESKFRGNKLNNCILSAQFVVQLG